MATQIKRRRGTTAQHDAFTGVDGEITVDTDQRSVVVHDGVTPGGFAQERAPYADVASMLSSPELPRGDGAHWDAEAFSYEEDLVNGTVVTAAPAVLRVLRKGEAFHLRAFGPTGGGADDTVSLQNWLNAAGDTQYGAGSFPVASPAQGAGLIAGVGEYRFTAPLIVPNNLIIAGDGWGTKFEFDPAVAGSDAFKLKDYTGAVATEKSSFSVRFRDFMLFVAPDGGTTTGRNGSDLATVNSNARHGINAADATGITCERVFFSDFHNGRGFHSELTGPTWAFYNMLLHCQFRDCWQGYSLTSASQAIACNVGHSVKYPAQSEMANHLYALDLAGARGCKVSGAIECYAATALINDTGAGHDISGLYLEAYDDTPAQIDTSSYPSSDGQSFHGGISYGYTKNRVINELVARTGIDNFNLGMNLNCGDYSEIEVLHNSTGQSPSFRYGLPGRGHYPAGGVLNIINDAFIDQTAFELVRGAGTAADDNQSSYNFKVRGSKNVLANVWVTVLAKLEGGETEADTTITMSDPSNARLKKVISYQNGWSLWATYVTPATDQNYTLLVRQDAGSVDPARKLIWTCLRAYTNGFAPVPTAYRGLEYLTAAPTAGDWLRGDTVWNSQPSAGGAPGWVCVTSGTPGTWKAMAALAA